MFRLIDKRVGVKPRGDPVALDPFEFSKPGTHPGVILAQQGLAFRRSGARQRLARAAQDLGHDAAARQHVEDHAQVGRAQLGQRRDRRAVAPQVGGRQRADLVEQIDEHVEPAGGRGIPLDMGHGLADQIQRLGRGELRAGGELRRPAPEIIPGLPAGGRLLAEPGEFGARAEARPLQPGVMLKHRPRRDFRQPVFAQERLDRRRAGVAQRQVDAGGCGDGQPRKTLADVGQDLMAQFALGVAGRFAAGARAVEDAAPRRGARELPALLRAVAPRREKVPLNLLRAAAGAPQGIGQPPVFPVADADVPCAPAAMAGVGALVVGVQVEDAKRAGVEQAVVDAQGGPFGGQHGVFRGAVGAEWGGRGAGPPAARAYVPYRALDRPAEPAGCRRRHAPGRLPEIAADETGWFFHRLGW
ncbi:MAG: hypothetical protein BWZ08_00794 [candidate division BRC1 bacterium ADurb.BinA292]|nr:MAG: hypothetical protein BWZ08_00794 [candidate division BRC1 bacterium ADurb.BinA292]